MGIHSRFPEVSDKLIRARTDRETRYAIEGLTTLSNEKGQSAAALVSNISNNGCRIVTLLPLRLGDRLKLVAEPLGLVEGEVCWTDGQQAGLKLITRDPLHRGYQLEVPK